jgi:hypothetical protein
MRPVAVIEIIAEEIFVVAVVPGLTLLRFGLVGFFNLGTSSSIGFSTTSWFSKSASSSVDIGSSLIACCSDGVRMSF